MAYENEDYDVCPLDLVQKVLGGKWKLVILWALRETKRFNELHRLFPSITQTMLTKQLRELESDGFVNRKIYNEIPPKVEYSLTEVGETFLPILQNIHLWGQENYDLLRKNKE